MSSRAERLGDHIRETQEEPANKIPLTTNPDQAVPPMDMDPGIFLDMGGLSKEVKEEFRALEVAREAIGGDLGLDSENDTKRWTRLQNEFWRDIVVIQSIHHDRFREFDSKGASSWYEVGITHAIELGSELVARRNLRQQLALAKKHGLESSMGSYLNLLDFHYAQSCSVKIGKVAFPDFVNPEARSTTSLFRFLVDGVLVITHNKGDEVLQGNQESSHKAYPNFIKSILWTFPKKIQSLLILDPATAVQVYRNARPPLNEIGQMAASLIRGMQETRTRMFSLSLNPYSKQFPEVKQALQGYLVGADRLTTFIVLNMLGLNQVANIQRLYLESRRHSQRGMEPEFFDLLARVTQEYANEASVVVSIPTEDDMELIADLDRPIDSAEHVPTLEELGTTVSAIFQKSSQKIYDIEPDQVIWQALYPAQTITLEIGKVKPKNVDVILEYEVDKGEIAKVSYHLDLAKGQMEWAYFADPQNPETAKVARFRSLLLCATASMLRVAKEQVEKQYRDRQAGKSPGAATRPPATKRERNYDPIYMLRKEVKAEQKQIAAQSSSHIAQEDIPIADILTSANIKDTITIPDEAELTKLIQSLSSEDQITVRNALAEFNQQGDRLKKLDHPGLNGRPRWSLRVACSAPKGIRVVLAPLEFTAGSRRFEIDYVGYRGNAYRRALKNG